jgi:NAD(P)-dependent dehydrogenase (short-subunit alcohol dehydrogenase family)
MFDLSGRTALVTGAGQGMGAGVARLLALSGAQVGVNDLHEERATETVAAIRQAGGVAASACFDVSDYAAVEAGVERVERELGPLDVLVNNAGVPPGMALQKFRDSQPADWRPYVELNLYGVMNCARAAVDGMCQRGFGRIITISSGAGTTGLNLGVSPYAAGKGGGISFMRHLAMEIAAEGVTANTVALGLMNNQGQPEVTLHLARGVPTGRLGEPEDVGAICVFLASNEASWMTGQTIQLNGGNLTT